MKKLAILIATLLIVCLMACACGTVDETSTPDSTPESTQTQTSTPTSEAPTSQAPTSEAPTSQAPVTPSTPAAGAVWQDFSALANAQGKGTEFSAVEGIFTITRGKGTTSSGKTVKEGQKNGTSFTGGVQLGKNGTAADKCISFTVPAGCTTVEIYANCGSTGVTAGGYTVQVNGTANALTCPNASIAAGSVTVAAGDQVVIFGGADGSINVWGIYVF